MINTKKFFNFLNKNKIEFFTGVPDSVLKETTIILNQSITLNT